MADVVDRQTRSRMMAGIKGKDTKPNWCCAEQCMLAASGIGFMPRPWPARQILCCRSTGRLSSFMVASGTDTTTAGSRPTPQPVASSGRRSLQPTLLGIVRFARSSCVMDGESLPSGSVHYEKASRSR